MSKRLKVIVGSVTIVILLMIFIIISKSRKTKSTNLISNNVVSDIQYDSQNSVYYITDKNTGERIGESEEEAGLQIYIDNPDYNPNPFGRDPDSTVEYTEPYRGVYDENTGMYVNEFTGEPIRDY